MQGEKELPGNGKKLAFMPDLWLNIPDIERTSAGTACCSDPEVTKGFIAVNPCGIILFIKGDGFHEKGICSRTGARSGARLLQLRFRRAQFHLGRCLENGIGCDKNRKEALTWYRRAAEQGHAPA